MYIDKRDFTTNSWGSNSSARWAFFVIFFVAILIIILGTMRVNKRRSRHGIQPIYGTRWITPPSYYQSQNQYDNGQRGGETTFVPEYTERANENDMGYYDNTGTFVPNPNAKATGTTTVTNLPSEPEASHQRQYSVTSGHVPAQDIDDHELYSRPDGPPPVQLPQATGSNDLATDVGRPSVPPPHLQTTGVYTYGGTSSESTTDNSKSTDDPGAPSYPPPNVGGGK